MRQRLQQLRELPCRLAVWFDSLVARTRDEAGQTVAEYALVLLVAAAVAGALLVWAKQSGKLDQFFDSIFGKLLTSVDPTPAP